MLVCNSRHYIRCRQQSNSCGIVKVLFHTGEQSVELHYWGKGFGCRTTETTLYALWRIFMQPQARLQLNNPQSAQLRQTQTWARWVNRLRGKMDSEIEFFLNSGAVFVFWTGALVSEVVAIHKNVVTLSVTLFSCAKTLHYSHEPG